MENKAKKVSLGALVCVFVCYACSVSTIPNGAVMGEATTFMNGFIGTIIAIICAFLTVLLTGRITYNMGVTKDIAFKSLFGRRGFMLCSIFFGFCQAFWACFDFFNAGQALYNLMPEGSALKNLGFCIAIAIMLVITILGGVFGMGALAKISVVTVPIAIILFAVIFVVSLTNVGGVEGLMAYQPSGTALGIGAASQIMFGMWMAGYIGCMDLTVEAKNTKHIAIAAFCFAVFIGLCIICGQLGFIATGMKTFGDICMSLGGAIFVVGNIFVLVAQGNTTPACNYMYSLSWSEGIKVKRSILAVIIPCIVAILAFVIMYGPGVDFINTIAGTVSNLMGPIVGVTIAEYYVIHKGKLMPLDEADMKIVEWIPCAIIILGAIFGYVLSTFTSVGPTAVIVILSTFVVDVIIRKAMGAGKETTEE